MLSKNLVKITYWKNSLLEYIKNKTKPYPLKYLEIKYERKTNVIQKLYYPKIDGYVIKEFAKIRIKNFPPSIILTLFHPR